MTNNTVASSTFSVTTGIATTSTPAYTFASKTMVPKLISVRATDTDNISSTGYETSATTTIRSGRIRLQNVYGSELLPLQMPVKVEYYDTATAAGWRTGTDTCTSLVSANFAYGFPTSSNNNLGACESAGILSGSSPTYSLSLSTPGSGNRGWANVVLNLGSSAIGTSSGVTYVKCTATGGSGGSETPANLSWLKFDWLGSGSTSNPTGRATFGVYKSPLIYNRENY